MNDKLLELYRCHWPAIQKLNEQCGGSLEGPFLTAPNEKYWSNALRIAFVGQETNGWTSHEDAQGQMEQYCSFNLGEQYYSSPFWNVIRKIERAKLESEYSSAWLNVNRYDEAGKRPSWEKMKKLSKLDFLLLEELRILSPHVTIFLSGPDYDWRLEALFGSEKLAVAGYSTRQLCEIKTVHVDGLLLRTYHPNYLRRSGLEEGIINKITETMSNRMLS